MSRLAESKNQKLRAAFLRLPLPRPRAAPRSGGQASAIWPRRAPPGMTVKAPPTPPTPSPSASGPTRRAWSGRYALCRRKPGRSRALTLWQPPAPACEGKVGNRGPTCST